MMRTSAVLLGTAILVCSLATAADTPHWSAAPTSLSSPDALAALQHANPRHYAIARRVLAAANEICDAGKPAVIATRFNAQDILCSAGIWMTSNPPKRLLQFRIDDTRYYALVIGRRVPARLIDGPLQADPPHSDR